ncbi:MAG TPA: HEAT repeat domain-containing protein [Pseudomonadota bacterium]|nr:HEAT repeat domain-containing protein [Pseudomonadota bacterium]
MSAETQGGGPPDLVGTVINDRYQIVERLSEGGMGVVYRALHTVLQSPFAIKVLLHPQMKKAQQHFLQEARLASKINHPNTVYIADFGVLADDRPYLAMEFLAGPTLSGLLKAGPMDALRAAQIALQIARGLQAVHDKGIIHCDLKPENVFVLKQGAQGANQDFVKIVDFGIATSLNQDQGPLLPDLPAAGERKKTGNTLVDADDANRTVTGGIVGTPPYMAPEQVRGQALDFRVDQYALGCILYQMLAGKVPFDGPNMNATLMSHIFDPVPPLASRGVTVPPSLEAVIMRLLSKEAAGRYASMVEVEGALATEIDLLQLQRGEKTAVPRALAASLGMRGRGSVLILGGRSVPLWLLAPMLLVLIGGGGFLAYQALRPREVRRELRPGELQQLRERALSVLQGTLRSTGAELSALRVAAAGAMGLSHDLSLRGTLEEQLQAAGTRGDLELQIAAAEALGSLGDRAAVPSLATLLEQAKDPAVRAAAARSLRQLGDPRGQAALTAMIEGSDPEAQLRAALLLCEGATGKAQALLANVSKQDQAPSAVRISALSCLSQGAEPKARSDARQALQALVLGGGPPAERATAAARLSELGDDTAREYLRTVVKRPGAAADQLLAARMLASPEEPSAVVLCRRYVAEKRGEASTRQLAAEGLAAGGDIFDARLLGEQLAPGESSAVQQANAAAILLLAAQDPGTLSAASLSWARSALQDRSALARLAAAATLADVQGAGAVALLADLAKDRDASVRRGAVRALAQRRESEALSALLGSLDDADPEVREETLRSLSRVASSSRKANDPGSSAQVMKRLMQISDQGSTVEQVLATGALISFGDSGQNEKLRSFQQSGDAEVRRLVVEQARGNLDILVSALKDGAAQVRFAAARRLAERGDRRAESALREALSQGGRDGVIALGLLRKLGVQVGASEVAGATAQPAAQPGGDDLNGRLSQIESLGQLPGEVALPLLRQASREADVELRRAAIDSLAELYRRERDAGVMATLRRMLSDSDAGVRARAAAAISALGTLPTAPSAAPSEATPPPKAPDDAVGNVGGNRTPTNPTTPVDAGTAPGTAVDGGSGAGAPEAGKGEDGETPEKPATAKVSQAEQLLRSGLESFSKREFKKAQRQLEKVNALCSRNKKAATDCALLMTQAGLTLGQIHESQKEPGEAMNEYQRVVALGGAGKADLRSQAERAVARLSPLLGQVVTLQRDKKGKCVQGTIWLPPGSHMVKLGGKIEPIEVQAQGRVQVGACP